MTYTIHVRVIDQSKPQVGFTIVEKTVWRGGTWSDTDSVQTLVMNSSGTSGALRLRSAADGEDFLVTLGVHNYKRWCDIVTDLADDDTAMKIQPTYYDSGPRGEMLWKQLPEISKTSAKGRTIDVAYVEQEDTVFHVFITIH